MTAAARRVIDEALTLTEAGRIVFAGRLPDPIEQEREISLDPEWLALIERRLFDFESGAVVGVSHEEVMASPRRATLLK